MRRYVSRHDCGNEQDCEDMAKASVGGGAIYRAITGCPPSDYRIIQFYRDISSLPPKAYLLTISPTTDNYSVLTSLWLIIP